ncbi:MAG: type II secretion system protein [Candidatus Staskawiczbacteria bacterium]|nr:type II secretion system protein [Candidatus Staskawiczbacteria bacterium]MBI3337092.1 type II secretion system protein [Candidatus Staskawiczbacteria bacterium]
MIFKIENKQKNKFRLSSESGGGFTLIEVIVVILILTVLIAAPIVSFYYIKNKSDLDNGIQEFTNILKLAQSRTLSSENNSQYGVYLDQSVSPNKYILFKGSDYALRDILADQTYFLSEKVEFFAIDLGGPNEIVFDKLTGATQAAGSVSLRLKSDTSQIKTAYISNAGTISFNVPAALSDDDRVKDSRHLQFDYSRLIDVNNENIVLNFNSGQAIQSIPISQSLFAGQIDWSGIINVGGANQTIRIHTNRLNNPDTQFSIHRDRRFNDKSLTITISADSSGYLAQYSADGLTTANSSIYVSNFVWQ